MIPGETEEWRPRETAHLSLMYIYRGLCYVISCICTNPCTKNAIRILKLRFYISGSVKQFLENNLGYCSHQRGISSIAELVALGLGCDQDYKSEKFLASFL